MKEYRTSVGGTVTNKLLTEYFGTLINRYFKILPMWESEEASLPVYINSLQIELVGCQEFLPEVRSNPNFLSLLSILQYFADHEDAEVAIVKREVFRAISICSRLKEYYGD